LRLAVCTSLGIGLTDAHLIASVFINLSTLCGLEISDSARPPKLLPFTPVWLRKTESSWGLEMLGCPISRFLCEKWGFLMSFVTGSGVDWPTFSWLGPTLHWDRFELPTLSQSARKNRVTSELVVPRNGPGG
jgi:hypothetical protein